MELAFIAPTLLALIFLVVQAAFLFYARSVALQTAREGVSSLRLAGQSAAFCKAQEQPSEKAAKSFADEIDSGALKVDRVDAKCDYAGSTVTVVVHGTAISLIGLTLHVTEQAEGRIECFQQYQKAQDDQADNCQQQSAQQDGG